MQTMNADQANAKRGRRFKRRAGAVALGIALLGAAPAAATAATVDAQSTQSQAASVAAAGDWRYIQDFFWGSDCEEAGENGKLTGAWNEYQCRNGGITSNYDLFVR